MADFGFYTQAFLGNRLSEKGFAQLAKQADAVLRQLERRFRVTGDAVSRDMAVCAMAEVLHDHAGRRGGVTAETVGSVSRRFSEGLDPDAALNRALYRTAGIWLDIERGIG